VVVSPVAVSTRVWLEYHRVRDIV